MICDGCFFWTALEARLVDDWWSRDLSVYYEAIRNVFVCFKTKTGNSNAQRQTHTFWCQRRSCMPTRLVPIYLGGCFMTCIGPPCHTFQVYAWCPVPPTGQWGHLKTTYVLKTLITNHNIYKIWRPPPTRSEDSIIRSDLAGHLLSKIPRASWRVGVGAMLLMYYFIHALFHFRISGALPRGMLQWRTTTLMSSLNTPGQTRTAFRTNNSMRIYP